MKNILLTFSILFSFQISAQELISVTYEGYTLSSFYKERYKNNPQKLAEMERLHEAASKIPSIHILTFNKNESSFSLEERIDNNQEENEFGIGKVSYTACNDMYVNLKKQYSLGEFDLGSKTYVIKEPLKKIDWKITQEKKEILGYEVRKATAEFDSITKVEAWYAPKLAYKNGPSQYWGLPGLILELNETNQYATNNQVKVNFIAVQIEPKPKSIQIKRFEKYEQITQAQYDEKLEEMQKVFREMHSDGVNKD